MVTKKSLEICPGNPVQSDEKLKGQEVYRNEVMVGLKQPQVTYVDSIICPGRDTKVLTIKAINTAGLRVTIDTTKLWIQ